MCYKWIEGVTYYDLNRAPKENELVHIIEQVAMINTTSFQPVYYHDIWAVPHIHDLANKVKPYLSTDDGNLISDVLRRFDKIELNELPKCLVHGDLTKGNVLSGQQGQPFIIDFSVTNWTTRIIELVLIVSNLLYDENDKRTIMEKAAQVASIYQRYNKLTKREVEVLADLSLAGSAMEMLGSIWRQNFLDDDSDETKYWLKLDRETIIKELKDKTK
jgi:Ser/Thr protein kinase RdoA (MazF antagonist)